MRRTPMHGSRRSFEILNMTVAHQEVNVYNMYVRPDRSEMFARTEMKVSDVMQLSQPSGFKVIPCKVL